MGRYSTKIQKKCIVCEKDYFVQKSRSQSKFCSNQCHGIHDKENKTRFKQIQVNCSVCGTSFFRHAQYLNKTKNPSCSKECYRILQKTDKNPLRRRKPRKCIICNNKFEVANHLNQKCCSKLCAREYVKKYNILKIPEENKSQFNVCCATCNKTFKVWNYRKNVKFCSRKCKHNYSRIIKICPTCKQEFSIQKYHSNRIFCNNECSSKGADKRKSLFFIEIVSFLEERYGKENIKTEVLIKGDNFKYFCDILIKEKFIIECFGDYWHCNPIKYKEDYFHSKIRMTAGEIWEKDKNRISNIENKSCKVMVIWENDWRQDKENIKSQIYEFYENQINKKNTV